jgi:hypothetical protein
VKHDKTYAGGFDGEIIDGNSCAPSLAAVGDSRHHRAAFALSRFINVYVEWLWFDSLGYASVYAYTWRLQLALFAIFSLATLILLRVAFRLIEKPSRPPRSNAASWWSIISLSIFNRRACCVPSDGLCRFFSASSTALR